ncbi:MAG: hypothetical protein ACTMIR_07305 [Cellulomonadaceae bacterium]
MLPLLTALSLLRAWITSPPPDESSERGSVTIEHVLWAVAVIAIVAVVVAAITTYVQNQSGLIS